MKLEPGGTQGGELKFLFGLLLAAAGLYLFFDSVRFTTGHHGLFSGAIGRRGGGGGGHMGQTTSMGIVLVPLFIGIVALFFDARKTWGWVVLSLGVVILIVEIVSRIRPVFDSKTTHVIMMMVMMGGGIGLMLKAYVEDGKKLDSKDPEKIDTKDPPFE